MTDVLNKPAIEAAAERERFENWYGPNYELVGSWKRRMNDGEYAEWKIELAWRAWHARAKIN